MKKNSTKNKSETNLSNKKQFILSANFFFILFILGFLFTTNLDNPTILGKYTISYFSKIICLFFLLIPYNLTILFLINNSIKFSINKKDYKMNLISRILIIIVFTILTILLTELFLRMKPKPFIENFHPYLQFITTKKNDGHLHVNSASFRYDEISRKKPKDVYRIFVLGGSTVFDKDRTYEKSITKQVENLLKIKYPDKKIQVINAGYERYTSEHSLIVYQTKVSDYDPDMIVIWQGFNDMIISCTPDFSPIREYKNDYSHFYQVLSNPIDNYFNWRIKLLSLERVKKAFLENYYADLRNKLPKPEQKINYTDEIEFKSIDAYKRNMEYIVKAAKADNVKIILGNQANQYDNNPKNYNLMQFFCKKDNGDLISISKINNGMKMFNDTSRDIAKKYQIPFIDLETALPKNSKYLTDDVHYTDLGANKVAEEVYKSIVNSEYLEE